MLKCIKKKLAQLYLMKFSVLIIFVVIYYFKSVLLEMKTLISNITHNQKDHSYKQKKSQKWNLAMKCNH